MNVENTHILEEKIDPHYVFTESDILDYAKWIGMDIVKDKDLLWIAEKALTTPLPEYWKPCLSKGTNKLYYLNFATGKISWDHPIDIHSKQLYEAERRKRDRGMPKVRYQCVVD